MEASTPCIHLICGLPGSGKTTYSRQLAKTNSATVFTIDDWIKNLYHPDFQNEPPELQWILDRIERCEIVIWSLCLQHLVLDTDVILDLGLAKKAHRDKFRALAAAENVGVLLHYLSAERMMRQKRVIERNTQKGQTYSFEVTSHMFDFMDDWIEVPDNQELKDAVIINT